MDKLKMHSVNGIQKNIEIIGKLFPDVITEVERDGEVKYAIDFDALRDNLSEEIVEGNEERYQFTWPDKKKAKLLANTPISATLRPVRKESVNFDTTENLYIEGDNLDVLKLLQETYLGKVKMIYIDPPYNTGNDFIYEDDFSQDAETYKQNSGQFDEQSNRLDENLESNGRFHTDWLNMIYPRIKLAKTLLSEDGVIFISIDDNEQENLKKCCDEIFGMQNFIAQLVWERAFSPKNDAKYISNSHDYILMYARSINEFSIGRLPRTEKANLRYKNPDDDLRGPWMSSDMSVKTYNENCDYPITAPSGRIIEPPAGRCWSLSKKAFLERLNDNRIWFGPEGDGVPRIKRFLSDLKFEGMAPTSILFNKEVGHSQEGSQEVSKLLNGGFFNGPKPVRLLQRLLILANLKENSIILDFFSGSSTTAHATMIANAINNHQQKFIMVQLPEECNVKTEAFQAGFRTLCDIGKERIRRAAKKIHEEHPNAKFDDGFRVLRLDSSNMKSVYYNPQDTSQDMFAHVVDNVKEDRTPEDLLFQVMLELDTLLSSKIEIIEIYGKNVFNVADGYLMACFDKNVTAEVVTEIAKKKPYYAVFRDASLADDSVATNFDQIFETYSKDTIRKVL
jgi:adenine-specific DNA-methyltransferase